MAAQETGAVKAVSYLGYVGAITFFEQLGIPLLPFGILIVLMGIDFVLGILKQWRLNPSGITSKQMKIGGLGKAVVLITILSLALLFAAIKERLNIPGLDGSNLLVYFVSILCVSETYSVIRNAYAVKTGEILPEFDVFTLMIRKIMSILKEYLERILVPNSK